MAGAKRRSAGGDGLLIHFLSDLMRKKRLQSAVVRDLEGAMKKHGLSPAKIAAVRSQSRTKIAAALSKEMHGKGAGLVPAWPPRPKPKPKPKPKKPKAKPKKKPK